MTANPRIARFTKLRQAACDAERVTLHTDPRRRAVLRAQWWLWQARTTTNPAERARCQRDAAFHRNLLTA